MRKLHSLLVCFVIMLHGLDVANLHSIRHGTDSNCLLRQLRLSGGGDALTYDEVQEWRQQHQATLQRLLAELEAQKENDASANSSDGQSAGGDDDDDQIIPPILRMSPCDILGENKSLDFDRPFAGFNDSILDMEVGESTLEEEENLLVKTGEDISPYCDDEYEAMQKEAVENGGQPLPNRQYDVAWCEPDGRLVAGKCRNLDAFVQERKKKRRAWDKRVINLFHC
mmetsp:Transcript_23368/g.63118  ORF Transcript_23368/g.63118 Transcript_23368/m.63118 type:complete len:226 (-) Transcript_23368:88-765(-)